MHIPKKEGRMRPRAHRRERLMTFDIDDYPDELKALAQHVYGHAFVRPSPDNRRVAMIAEYEIDGSSDKYRRYILDGQIVAESANRLGMLVIHSYSFDGTKLAVAIPVIDGDEYYYMISINGEEAYRVDLTTIAHIQWISNEELAWEGWTDRPDGRVVDDLHYFVNGEETTGEVEFECYYPRRGVPWLKVRRGNECFLLKEDGSIHSRWTVGDGEDEEFRDYPPRDTDHEEPEDTIPYDRRGVRIKYCGVTGPRFDEIHSAGVATPEYSYNPDRSKVGYIGKRYRFYSGVLQAAGLYFVALVLRLPPNFHADPPGGRYHPVSNGREWHRSYRDIHDHMYTPHDEFVVVAQARHGQRVVIEESEGPAFEEVHHLRYLEDEGCLSYIGRLGSEYYRVTVDA